MMGRRKDADGVADATKEESQRGIVMVWMVAALFVLIGAAAFAVDLVHAYVVAQETQNAADAAALAGAAQIPGGCAHASTAATSLAATNLGRNGFTALDYVATPTCTSSNEVTVDIKTHFNTWFARAIGFPSMTVHRKGVAEYDPPVKMGSPDNHLGDIPGGSCTDVGFSPLSPPYICASDPSTANQNLFLQINGPDTFKSNGNAVSSNYCGMNTDGCSATNSYGVNTDYNSNPDTVDHGQYYMIDSTSGTGLDVAVYDAGFVNTGVGGSTNPGSWCNSDPTQPDASAGGDAVRIKDANPARYNANLGLPIKQYSQFCAGDISDGDSLGRTDTNLVYTHYELLVPDTDTNPVNNTVATGSDGKPCRWDIPGVYVHDHAAPNTQGIMDQLPDGPNVYKYFEQWQVLCDLPTAGTTAPDHPYELHVWSDSGQGTNAFSIMALHNLSGSPGAPLGLNVYAQEQLPLYASKPDTSGPGNPATFYVARVVHSNLDRQLNLALFDLGDSPDASSGLGLTNVQLTFTTDGSGLGACQYTVRAAGVETATPPWGGPYTWQSEPSCDFSATISTWKSHWVIVQLDIPPSYTCNDLQANKCWIKMTMDPGSHNIQDNTTWDANLNGAPVRLVG
jgi:hypothetical protein